MIIWLICSLVLLVVDIIFLIYCIYDYVREQHNDNKSKKLLKLEKLCKKVSNKNNSDKKVSELINFCFEICKSMVLKNRINDLIHLESATDQFVYIFSLVDSPFITSNNYKTISNTKENIWLIEQANEKMDFCYLDYNAISQYALCVTLRLTMKNENNN